MSGSKKHNSIVFLTTLSVYLGLVLVGGASSPVLAQAALTRNFDIQEELEYKDDLDKKPEDELCSELGKNAEKQLKQFGFSKWIAIDFANLIKSSITDFVVTNNELNFSKDRNAFIDFLLPKSNNSKFEPSVTFKIAPEKSVSIYNFTYTLESPTDTYLLASAFDYGFKFENCISKDDKFSKIIYTNAEISHSNNQVTIVTRLPRASIDSLLA
ncbi:MAG: hypothetical protein ACR2F2_06420 [Pyrinomonadaceae bacterium]